MRNRIISGLADILLVVEARKKSGTYITVCQALEQGKEIFAVPGRITDGLSDGCNRLIEEGAGIASDPVVILEALGCKAGNLESQLTLFDSENNSGHGKKNSSKRVKESNLFTTDAPEQVEKAAVMKALEETPKKMEEILTEVKHYGVDLSYSDLLCLLTDLCIEGRAEGGGDYYRAIR